MRESFAHRRATVPFRSLAIPYLDCPRCHASFPTGTIYAPRDFCPRCGQSFAQTRRRLRLVQNRGIFAHRRADRGAPDWEAITESQYVRRRVSPPDP